MGCFSMKLREGIAFEEKLISCINTVVMVSDKGWNKPWLVSDCTQVIELLYSRSMDVAEKYKVSWKRVLGHLQHMEALRNIYL